MAGEVGHVNAFFNFFAVVSLVIEAQRLNNQQISVAKE